MKSRRAKSRWTWKLDFDVNKYPTQLDVNKQTNTNGQLNKQNINKNKIK